MSKVKSVFKNRKYTADFPVIDMDGHIWDPPKIFSEYLPAKFREEAKEAFPDSPGGVGLIDIVHGRKVRMGHKYRMYAESHEAWDLNQKEPGYRYPGEDDPYVRLSCMDFEGIDSTIVRNTVSPGIFHADMSKHAEMAKAICVAYNDWIYDFCSADKNRLFPEAMLPCFDMDAALKEMERNAKRGFKSTCLPGSTAVGTPLSDPYWDKLFACMEEAGWPLFIHPGFDPLVDSITAHLQSPNKMNSYSASAYFSIFLGHNFLLDNIVTLGEITLGGMLDKHPRLNVAFIESGSTWQGEVIYRLDKQFHVPFVGAQVDGLNLGMETRAKTPPSELLKRQIYFMFEGGDRSQTKEGVERMANNLVWCSDTPHYDGDGPWEGGGCLRDILKVDKKVEAQIMGGNAAKVLNVPYEKRIGTSKNTKAIPEPILKSALECAERAAA